MIITAWSVKIYASLPRQTEYQFTIKVVQKYVVCTLRAMSTRQRSFAIDIEINSRFRNEHADLQACHTMNLPLENSH